MTTLQALISIIDRHAKSPRQFTSIDGLSIFNVKEPTSPVDSVYAPRICMVLQGQKRISSGGRTFDVHSGQYFMSTIDLPVSASITAASEANPHFAWSLELSRQDLVEVLQRFSPAERPSESFGLTVGDQSCEMAETAFRLLGLLDRPDELVVLLHATKFELYYRFLQSEHGALLRDFATNGTMIANIGKVTSWIKDNFAKPMTILELANRVGMSPTSLHRHFKALTTMSPFEYRSAIRLQEARRRLLIGGVSARRVAFDVGYDSQTQFTREYKRLFGRPPAADTAHLRGVR
ncbi:MULTISPECIES: AraC family transcriptional regulator [unclassified Rhizobium]|jgi:AraC-like DNA-binding protein|uniref:AraC family transcriptional regulator n=1 Tax=unclassified Rhizobium TaxID=2613769 RepID=UPI00036F0BBE|nr:MULTISPECIES: AraC family transcriptional regulator [unclassified Rhizobium]MBB3447292.1 AraC-like DNA-binding protein [Rhizobium sp. BK379]MBB3565878.1 AraC-like DNA-binding protein [Rhizobium sp. BK512]